MLESTQHHYHQENFHSPITSGLYYDKMRLHIFYYIICE